MINKVYFGELIVIKVNQHVFVTCGVQGRSPVWFLLSDDEVPGQKQFADVV